MGLKPQNHKKVLKIVSIPLAKARDLYIKSMKSWESRASYGHCMWATVQLPKSYSVSSSTSDDFRDLIRPASMGSLGYASEIDMLLCRAKVSPEICSVGAGGHMGRIDEDTTEEDGGVCGVVGETAAFVDLCPGSKSYAIGRTTAF